jgi:hypothetical protein
MKETLEFLFNKLPSAFQKVFKHEMSINRWADGVHHHPKSIELMSFLKEVDFHVYGDNFRWQTGGDGDNGETLMYEMDAYFEAKDRGDL